MGCEKPAQWILYDRADELTYSCHEHLPDMIAVDMVEIQAHNEAEELACCFICTTNDQRYTLTEIKAAFKAEFHNAGELWFGGSAEDWTHAWCEFAMRLTGLSWGELYDKLREGLDE